MTELNIAGRIRTQPDVQTGSLGRALKEKLARDESFTLHAVEESARIWMRCSIHDVTHHARAKCSACRAEKQQALDAANNIVDDYFAFESVVKVA